MKKLQLLIFVLVVGLGLMSMAPVLAQQAAPDGYGSELSNQLQAAAGENGANLGEPIDPRATVVVIIRFFLNMVGLGLLLLNIYAGYLWLTAGGNDEQIAQAKGYLRNGVIGLIIVLSSYAITIFAANLARGYSFTAGGLTPFLK